jgi:hypothetical protein
MQLPAMIAARESYWTTCALPGQRLLNTLLFPGLQVKGVAFDILDNIFLLDLALETPQRIFQGFALLQYYFRQSRHLLAGRTYPV